MSEKSAIPTIEEVDDYEDFEQATKVWSIVLHLSQFGHFLFFGGGVILPIAIWFWKKKTYPTLDFQAKAIFDWQISIFLIMIFLLLPSLTLPYLYNYFGGVITETMLWVNLIYITAVQICVGLFLAINVISSAIKAAKEKFEGYPFSIHFFRG